MPTLSNKHIKKFNQLVEVYEPDGIEPIEVVESHERAAIEQRQSELAEHRGSVEALGVGEFFEEEREREIRESESHPDPSAVAESQREEMLDRLDSIEHALAEALDGGEVLDTDEQLDW